MNPDDIEQYLADELSMEIDKEIIKDLAIMHFVHNNGWHLVKTQYDHPWQPADEDWLAENIRGDHRNYGNIWVFESSEEAVLFAMRYP